MKICRITKYLPSDHAPGVQHAYFLTQYIKEPTLIIVKKTPSKIRPVPMHAAVKEISYSDFAFTSGLEEGFLQNGATRLKQKVDLGLKAILKVREIVFFVKSIPILVRFRPDIVHSHGLITLLPGLFAKSFLGSHFVITVHNVTEALLSQKLPFLKHLLKVPDKIICVSDGIREMFLKTISAEKLEVIPTAVDPGIFRNLNLGRKNQLISVGYFKWQKGYSYMIEAVARVFSKFTQYQLLIIGDGPERTKIQGLIEQLHLTDRIRLLGALPQEEIARHLNESRLFIMSSLAEGLPKALLEAAACGTPAVVTTACNAEGIIEKVGVSVKPGDSLALAAAIEELLHDEERWKTLSKNCFDIVKDYDWETVSSKVFDLYKELSSNSAGYRSAKAGIK